MIYCPKKYLWNGILKVFSVILKESVYIRSEKYSEKKDSMLCYISFSSVHDEQSDYRNVFGKQ